MNYSGRKRNLNGHRLGNWHSTPSRQGFWRHQSSKCLTLTSPLWLSRTPPSSYQERYYDNRTPMVIGTRAVTYHNLSTLQNGITRSTTGNYWPSFGLSPNGTTTYLGPHTLSRYYQITRTLPKVVVIHNRQGHVW